MSLVSGEVVSVDVLPALCVLERSASTNLPRGAKQCAYFQTKARGYTKVTEAEYLTY
jgi:hypothetical protein